MRNASERYHNRPVKSSFGERKDKAVFVTEAAGNVTLFNKERRQHGVKEEYAVAMSLFIRWKQQNFFKKKEKGDGTCMQYGKDVPLFQPEVSGWLE